VSSTTRQLYSGLGGESGPDTNGLRTNIALPWITRTSCGSWGMQTGNETTPRVSRMTIKFSSSRGRQICGMAIGKSGQTGKKCYRSPQGATSVRVYARQNEVFVSDGYGNSRVWCMTRTRGSSNACGRVRQQAARYGPASASRTIQPNELCPMYAGYGRRISNFIAHDIKFSSDGLAYVAAAGTSGSRCSRLRADRPEQFIGVDMQVSPAGKVCCLLTRSNPEISVRLRAPDIYILNRRTLEVLGSFNIRRLRGPSRAPDQCRYEGNVYAVQAELSGADE